jgi:hypothetical protein
MAPCGLTWHIMQNMCVGSLYAAYIPCRYQFIKYSLGSQPALYSVCVNDSHLTQTQIQQFFSILWSWCRHMSPVQVVPKIFLEMSHSCIIFFSLFPQLIKTFSLMCKLFAWWPVGTSRPYCLNTTLCLATVFNICVTQRRAAYWLKMTHRDLKTFSTSRVKTRWLMSLAHKHK